MNEVLSEANPPKNKIRILLADDHPLLRQALRNILEKQADFEVVAEAGDGEEAVRLATELMPDVVVMDISMPKISGLEATRQIKEKSPNIIILVLTVHDDSEHILGILEVGAAGYLCKSVFGEEVIHTVRSVIGGETVLSPQVAQLILKYSLRHATKPLHLYAREKLTTRELEILKLAATGMSNNDIALKLKLSLATIKSYLSDIFVKLGVGSRTEAVITAFRAGLLTTDDLR
jgi:NarL family two-component system response regulator LiaR